jgi:hypothetical protein
MKASIRVAAVAAALLLSFSLAACSSGGGSSSSSESADETTEQTSSEITAVEDAEHADEKGAKEEDAGQSDDAKDAESAAAKDLDVAVTIDRVQAGTDYEGNPTAVITFTFTNVSSDEPESFLLSCYGDVYQNGVQCELAYAMDLEGDSSTKVKAGSSTTFQQAYKVADSSDIEIEVRELFAFDQVLLASGTFAIG